MLNFYFFTNSAFVMYKLHYYDVTGDFTMGDKKRGICDEVTMI
ncbi:hypothetical protein ABIC45_004616 [Mucilaginibacter rubeus]